MRKIETRPNGTRRVSTINNEKTKTQRQHKDASDVNHIMKKYKALGGSYNTLPVAHFGRYVDHTTLPSYQDGLDLIVKANQAFNELPAHVRKYFENDPAQYLAFLGDPKNEEEGIRLGLLTKKIQEPPAAPKNDDLNDEKPAAPKAPKSKKSEET